VKLREKGERLIAAYVAPEPDRLTISNDLIRLFDGPCGRSLGEAVREHL